MLRILFVRYPILTRSRRKDESWEERAACKFKVCCKEARKKRKAAKEKKEAKKKGSMFM